MSTAREDEPWSALERAAVALFALALGTILACTLHDWFDATFDSATYLITARSLAAGEGYTFLGEPFRLRPPGLAALITPILAQRGPDFASLNLLIGLFGVACAVLLVVFQRDRIGVPLALTAALAVWLLPGFQRLSGQVMSDVPGAAFLLLILVVERWSARAPTVRGEALLGFVIGLGCYFRTTLILLVPAIWLARILQRRPDADRKTKLAVALRFAIFALVAGLTVLPWSVRNACTEPDGPVDQVMQYSFGTWWLHEDPGDPQPPRLSLAQVLERVPERGTELLGALGHHDLGMPGWPRALI